MLPLYWRTGSMPDSAHGNTTALFISNPTSKSAPAAPLQPAPLPPRASDLRGLLQLGWPMLVGQLAQVAMGVVDTAMAGSVGALDLAAVAVGFSLWIPIL